MLSRFIHTATNESGTVDYKYLRDIILNIVIAGKDTTAGALAWFLYMACKHPEIQEKICQEAAKATSASETAGVDEFAQSLTDEALNKMHYLHAALTETLRLYPSVPLVSSSYSWPPAAATRSSHRNRKSRRMCQVMTDHVVAGGTFRITSSASETTSCLTVPASARETSCSTSPTPWAGWSTSGARTPRCSGRSGGWIRTESSSRRARSNSQRSRYDDGLSFSIKRQLVYVVTELVSRRPCCASCLPQAGPRICLGKEFAYRQMKIFAAVLLRFFVFRLRDGDKASVNYRTMITLHIDEGLHLTATAR